MIQLRLNNRPFPDSLLGNLVYLPVVLVNNREKPAEHWVLSNGSGIVISSNNPSISFALVTAVPHALHVYARNEHGIMEEGLVSFSVVLQGSGTIRAGVNWSQSTYQVGDRLEGTVYLADPEGFPPISLEWTIYRNSVPVYSGKGNKLSFAAAIDGVYTVKISAHDIRRTLIQAESTIFVTQNYALQATPPPPSLDGSLVLLGTLYSHAMSGPAGAATTLPYALASYTQDFNLLPGTTHLVFQVDGTVDDDVVVRTKIGNFALVGYSNGLYNSRLGYDYKASVPVPAPADLKTRLTFDAYNAHGSTYSAFNFRVKILCYAVTDQIYRYEQCPYAIHPGGAGLRQRRLAFIFTEVDALVDVDSQRDRYQTHGSVISYSTPEATSLPGQSLLNDGSPDTVNPDSGMFFTEANRYAIYEADDADELDGKAVCAIEDVRPFYFTLQMPAQPPVVQVIKRLKGRMVLYLANGCLLAGTVLRAYVATGTGDVLFTFSITEDVYNNSTDTFVRVMSQPVDLSDFQFGISGVVVRCTINESGVSYAGTTPDVLPVWSEGSIYSKTYSLGVNFDGACFVNPVLVETLDANSGAIATAIVGCHDPACGPQGVYCYTETCSPYTATITVVQSLYHPAPFVASPANQYLCYGSPVFKNAGSLYVEGGGTVAANTKIFAYADSSLCGLVSVYEICSTGDSLGVVYPCATVPHDYVKYGDSCYAFQYTATTANVELPGLNFITFNNWMAQGGTFDLIGSTPVYTLYDLVPGNGMYADMLGSPTTNFGTLVSKQAWELTAGDYAIDITFAGNQRTDPNPTPFSIGVTVGSYGTAWYENGKEQPFETHQLAFTVAGSEYATVNVFQNTASFWGGIYNAGNLLKSVHLYRTAPTADDLLIENFEYTPTPPLPDTVVSVSDVTVVADCQDEACTGLSPGVSVTNQVIVSPRLNRVNVIDVDLLNPGVRVQLTAPSGSLSTERQSTLDFLVQTGAQVAVNAHRFWPYPSSQVAVNLEGVAASNGVVFESFFNAWRIAPPPEGWPALNIDPNNQAAVVYGDPLDPAGQTPLGSAVLYNTVSGNYQVVTNGVPIADVGDSPAPRVGMGVMANGHLLIVEVDGSQPGFSEGLTVSELGTLMASMGAVDAINADGGGSATVAMRIPAPDGTPQVYNSPSVSPPRTVGSNLAIFFNRGDSVAYLLTETGSRARVAFDGLSLGIPHFGVAAKATSTGLNGLAAGSLAFVISKSRQTIIRQVAGTGVLAFGLTLTGTDKTFIRKRGGAETNYFLPAGRGSVTIDVVPGDTIYLDFGRISVRTLKRPCVVVWQPRVAPLREYDTAVLNESGSIKALGFCGLTNRSDYTVFSTLPVDAQTDDVVNPDALVTVSGSDGIQYALVRNAAYNEAKPPLPFNWYSGQTLNGSMTFHFYASRKTYGAHGEMDVWTTTDGTFPEFFRISEFFGLSGSNAVRVDSQDGDMRRNGLQTVTSLDGIERPGQYRASDGELRTFDSQSGTVSTDKIFSLVGVDEGISFKMHESPPPPPLFSPLLDGFRVSEDDGATFVTKPLGNGFNAFSSIGSTPSFSYTCTSIKLPNYPLMDLTCTVMPLVLGDYVLEWTGINMSGMLGADLIQQFNALSLYLVSGNSSVRFTCWTDPNNALFGKTVLIGDLTRTANGTSSQLSSTLVPAHYPYSMTFRLRFHVGGVLFPFQGITTTAFFLPH